MRAVNTFPLRRYLAVVLLEGYAILLALTQSLSGVKTDEAKYLLDVPYPHPPLLRFFMGLTEPLPFQELFWRLVLATLLVQAVWIVADLVREWHVEKRLTLCVMWLTAGSLMLQAGSIMMAPVTALQGLVFVWLLLRNQRPETRNQRQLGWIALFWLASLFTAYQAILYAPIVWMIFRRAGMDRAKTALAVGVPVALVVLYVLQNPLAIESFVSAGGQNPDVGFTDKLSTVVIAWLASGSVILSMVGLSGMLRKRAFAFSLSFLLVCAFLFVSFRAYYPVLFLPLLIAGVASSENTLRRVHIILALQIVVAALILAQTPLSVSPSPARRVMERINELPGAGTVLIQGSFGHEWQYESESPVLRFRTALVSKAKAAVCLVSCPEIAHYGFYQVQNLPEEVWVRK